MLDQGAREEDCAVCKRVAA
jgi:hypothetical protein